MPRRYVYIASVDDIAKILLGTPIGWPGIGDVHHQLPPDGFDLHVGSSRWPPAIIPPPLGATRLPLYIDVGEDSGDVTGWWWSTLGSVISHLSSTQQFAVNRIITAMAADLGLALGALLDAPVVLKGSGPVNMRWLQTTMRGELFGEQFQHKLDWGNPGADPTTSEAEGLTLADSLATAWATTMAASLLVAFSPDVVYTEVGVVELNQTDPGGDVTESWGTQWSMYATGARPVGGSATTCMPYEVSCCVSLQTDHRGPSGKGRFYLPPMSKDSITVHGLHNMGVVSPVIVAVGNYIDDVKASTDLKPIVVSRTHRILNEITSINCGIVPDSQRRRRRSISEARVAEWTSA